MRSWQRNVLALAAYWAAASAAFAAHPFVTDDANTQGKGRYELQLGAQLTRDDADGSTLSNFQFAPQLTYGVVNTLDVLVRPTYDVNFASGAEPQRASGFGDVFAGFKWRLFERKVDDGQLAAAISAGSGFPVGNAFRGLDAGRATPYGYLILMKSTPTLQLQGNAGAIRNADIPEGRNVLGHVSAAALYTPRRGLQLGVDVAADQNPLRAMTQWPAIVLVGAIYTLNAFCDIDAGYQRRLNHSAPDNQYLIGATLRW